MKTKSIILMFVLAIVLSSCIRELTLDQKIIKYEEKIKKNWICEIDSIFEGNFTDSGLREILVFFNLSHKESNAKTLCTVLFLFKNENICNAYDIYYRKNLTDKRNFIKEIKEFDVRYQNAIISDFNKNGKLELIYFLDEGSVSVFYIEEFKDGEFKHICQVYDEKLNISGLDNYDLTHFDFENKAMYLSDRESTEKIKLTWNPETEFYEKEILQE